MSASATTISSSSSSSAVAAVRGPATAVTNHHHSHSHKDGHRLCSSSRIWKAVQDILAKGNKKAWDEFACVDAVMAARIKDSLLQSTFHNNNAKFAPSQKHKVLQFEKALLTQAHYKLGKVVRNLNCVQLAMLRHQEALACAVFTFIRGLATDQELRRFVNAQWSNNNTSLHMACFLGMTDVVRLYVEAGADLTIKNGRGFTPVQCTSREDILVLLTPPTDEENALTGTLLEHFDSLMPLTKLVLEYVPDKAIDTEYYDNVVPDMITDSGSMTDETETCVTFTDVADSNCLLDLTNSGFMRECLPDSTEIRNTLTESTAAAADAATATTTTLGLTGYWFLHMSLSSETGRPVTTDLTKYPWYMRELRAVKTLKTRLAPLDPGTITWFVDWDATSLNKAAIADTTFSTTITAAATASVESITTTQDPELPAGLLSTQEEQGDIIDISGGDDGRRHDLPSMAWHPDGRPMGDERGNTTWCITKICGARLETNGTIASAVPFSMTMATAEHHPCEVLHVSDAPAGHVCLTWRSQQPSDVQMVSMGHHTTNTETTVPLSRGLLANTSTGSSDQGNVAITGLLLGQEGTTAFGSSDRSICPSSRVHDGDVKYQKLKRANSACGLTIGKRRRPDPPATALEASYAIPRLGDTSLQAPEMSPGYGNRRPYDATDSSTPGTSNKSQLPCLTACIPTSTTKDNGASHRTHSDAEMIKIIKMAPLPPPPDVDSHASGLLWPSTSISKGTIDSHTGWNQIGRAGSGEFSANDHDPHLTGPIWFKDLGGVPLPLSETKSSSTQASQGHTTRAWCDTIKGPDLSTIGTAAWGSTAKARDSPNMVQHGSPWPAAGLPPDPTGSSSDVYLVTSPPLSLLKRDHLLSYAECCVSNDDPGLQTADFSVVNKSEGAIPGIAGLGSGNMLPATADGFTIAGGGYCIHPKEAAAVAARRQHQDISSPRSPETVRSGGDNRDMAVGVGRSYTADNPPGLPDKPLWTCADPQVSLKVPAFFRNKKTAGPTEDRRIHDPLLLDTDPEWWTHRIAIELLIHCIAVAAAFYFEHPPGDSCHMEATRCSLLEESSLIWPTAVV